MVHAQHAAPRHAVVVRARRLPRAALAAVARAVDRRTPRLAVPCVRPPRRLIRCQPLPRLELCRCCLQGTRVTCMLSAIGGCTSQLVNNRMHRRVLAGIRPTPPLALCTPLPPTGATTPEGCHHPGGCMQHVPQLANAPALPSAPSAHPQPPAPAGIPLHSGRGATLAAHAPDR